MKGNGEWLRRFPGILIRAKESLCPVFTLFSSRGRTTGSVIPTFYVTPFAQRRQTLLQLGGVSERLFIGERVPAVAQLSYWLTGLASSSALNLHRPVPPSPACDYRNKLTNQSGGPPSFQIQSLQSIETVAPLRPQDEAISIN